MHTLTSDDHELIAAARAAIAHNYNEESYNHTVGAALRCRDGKIYTGVNCYALHGPCAETIAVGKAITDGQRAFDCIVAVSFNRGGSVLSPCGNCRQMLFDYMQDCEVIVETEAGLRKVSVRELLPYAYVRHDV